MKKVITIDSILETISEVLKVNVKEIDEKISLLQSLAVDSTECLEIHHSLEKKFKVSLSQSIISNDSSPIDILTQVLSIKENNN